MPYHAIGGGSGLLNGWIPLAQYAGTPGHCIGDFQHIPGGVTVSLPIIELNRHPDLFQRPDDFDPTRWMDETQLPTLKEYVQPFSIGGRACIGRNLAMIELTKVVATVVNRYEVELLQDDLAFVERFNMNPGACHVKLSRRFR